MTWAVLLGSCLLSSPVLASDEYVESETRMAARVLAAQGSEAFEQKDFARALELFGRASAIIPAPTITLMEARTLVELGRLVEAAEKYASVERMVPVDPTNAVFRDAGDAAQLELPLLLQRIPTLRVRLVGAAPGEKVEIQVDGRKVLPTLAALDSPTDPGPHHVEVRTARGVFVREVTLVERQHEDVVVTVAPPPQLAPAPAPAPPPKAAPKPADEGSTTRTVGWVIAGSGAAFVGLGAVTGVIALNHKADLDAVCTPSCPASSADDIDAFRRNRTLSYVGFGLGAAGLAGGLYLVLRPLPRAPVALNVAPTGVSARGSFW